MIIRDIMVRKTTRCLALFGAAAAVSFIAFGAQAQENSATPSLTLRPADPTEKGDGTLSPAAKAAIEHGPLPFSDADVAAKEAANRARDEAEKSGAKRPFSPADLSPAGGAGAGPLAPVFAGFNKQGLVGIPGERSPPDTTGAIGPTRYIQLVNTQAGIIDRTKTTPGTFIAVGTLNQLAGIAASVNSFDPQVIWDPATNRFYYTMESIFSASDQRLSFGFSTTPSPNNVTTDWCHYTLGFGPLDPDYPKLGDSQFFLIIGVNTFRPRGHFVGSDLIAISKPAAGTACPAFGTFKVGVKLNLVDSGGHQVFTPVPANQIDPSATGFVVAISQPLPSDKLWFFNVTRNSTTGFPLFGPARGVTVRTYAISPDADQPVFTQKLHTLDARMTQAVQAIDPRFGTFSFWTQHTVLQHFLPGSGLPDNSLVRWYEINPVPETPVVLHWEGLADCCGFFFNAAISPDRRSDGTIHAFGNDYVIEYNYSCKICGINPLAAERSSFKGGVVRAGVGPYRDKSCTTPGSTCRWGDYSAATPDPRPVITGSGVVWGTNQFSGLLNPPADGVNWLTQIFALQP